MKKKNTAAVIFIALVMIYLLIPLFVTAVYSAFEKWTSLLPEHFQMIHYVQLLTEKDFLMSLLRTLIICVIPIALTVLLVLLALFVTTIYFPQLEKYVQLLCMIPYMIQGVILSVSIISLYAGSPTFLSNRIIMLTGAYCIIILPYIYQGIRNSMRAVNMKMLLEAAEMLGCTKLYGFSGWWCPILFPASRYPPFWRWESFSEIMSWFGTLRGHPSKMCRFTYSWR